MNTTISTTQKLLIGSSLVASLLAMPALAEDKEFHDADPRNSSFRGGIAAYDDGEIKLASGGGWTNLTSENSQTNMVLEYYTETENLRYRLAHFDASFGGAYVDLSHVEDFADIYTVGYMLPLKSADGTMFFPSVNYTYMDWDLEGMGNTVDNSCSGINNGYPDMLQQICSSGYTGKQLADTYFSEGDSHEASVNLYILKPWNDTHYTVIQMVSGKSYSGTEVNNVNLMWLQGIRTKVNDNIFNIYLELKYDYMEIQGTGYNPIMNTGGLKSEDFRASIGFDFRF